MIKKIGFSLLVFAYFNVAIAQQPFVVSDIKVTGLERIAAGTIFNYLPVKVGDTFDQSDSASLIRAMYKTGFFEKIELAIEGSAIVLKVDE